MIDFGPMRQIVFSQALLRKEFPLSLTETTKFYTLPQHLIADWDVMANRFYQTLYTP